MNKLVKHYKKLYKGTNEKISYYVKKFCDFNNLTCTNFVIHDGYVTFDGWSNITYENLVNQLIAERYTIQDELAIQRKHQKGVNDVEFEEYYEFVEQCKIRAKEFIAERESVVNG